MDEKTDIKVLSIVTVCFNAEKTIRDTIESVLKQKQNMVEYIVIDGNSKDETKKILKEYASRIDTIISEPDDGIYDAMNKAISIAKGNWLYFLGADDVLLPLSICKILPFMQDNSIALLYGNVKLSNGQLYESSLGPRILLQNTIHHQGAFYNKNLFNFFKYDVNLKILSDYELNLKIFIQKLATLDTGITIAKCYVGGASSNFSISLDETNQIRKRFIKKKITNSLLSLLLKLYYSQKELRRFLFKVSVKK